MIDVKFTNEKILNPAFGTARKVLNEIRCMEFMKTHYNLSKTDYLQAFNNKAIKEGYATTDMMTEVLFIEVGEYGIKMKECKEWIENLIYNRTLSGSKREVRAYKWLSDRKKKFRPATPQEDINKGFDIVCFCSDGTERYIQVKPKSAMSNSYGGTKITNSKADRAGIKLDYLVEMTKGEFEFIDMHK